MRLTFVNFLNKVRPHGHLYRGKNRKVRPIKLKELVELKKDFQREESNMLLLRHPYLTAEQVHGYKKELREVEQTLPPTFMYGKLRALKFSRQYTLEDALCHLKVTNAWD